MENTINEVLEDQNVANEVSGVEETLGEAETNEEQKEFNLGGAAVVGLAVIGTAALAKVAYTKAIKPACTFIAGKAKTLKTKISEKREAKKAEKAKVVTVEVED